MNFREKQEFDVLIIGGGIIGLSIARELKKNGVERVAILERNDACGMEASFAAAGMLAPQAEANSADDFFRLCQQSRDLYPQYAAELLAQTEIDIELDQTGTLYLAFDEEDLSELERRFEWQSAANLPVEKLNEWEIAELEPNLSKLVVGALRFPLDWQVENQKIVKALNKNLTGVGLTKWMQHDHLDKVRPRTGGEFISVEVESLIFEDGRIKGVKTEFSRIDAPIVIVAAGAWTSLINFSEDLAAIKVSPVRGQILSFSDQGTLEINRQDGKLIPRKGDPKTFKHTVYTPRGYIVPRKDYKILVGATVENAGFENRTTGAGVASLLQTAFEISPQFQNLQLKKFWSGLRPKSPDGLPLLGEFPADSGLYFATGHYRNGILLAPVTAKLIADKITKNIDSPFLKIFNPGRFVNG